MTREFLKNLGITDTQIIDNILDENSKDIGKTKSEFGNKEDTLKALQEENSTLKAENVTIKNSLEEALSGKKKQDNELENLITELNGYKRSALQTKIAVETGLPLQLAARLTGEDEAQLREDSITLLGLIKENKPTLPLASSEPKQVKSEDLAFRTLLQNLEGE